MAKAQRKLLFVAVDRAAAVRAQVTFNANTVRLGQPWLTEVSGPEFSPEVLAGVSAVVAVDLPDYSIPNWTGRLEHLTTTPDIHQAVNGLIARLLGGSDAPLPPPPPPPAPPKKVHTVKLSRETAGRRGKGVTVISELPLNETELKELATQLKNKCGTGGTAKDGRIEIQGDHRDKIAEELERLGYKVKRSGG